MFYLLTPYLGKRTISNLTEIFDMGWFNHQLLDNILHQRIWFQPSGRTQGLGCMMLKITPPKFKLAPEKWCLEDEFPFGIALPIF